MTDTMRGSERGSETPRERSFLEKAGCGCLALVALLFVAAMFLPAQGRARESLSSQCLHNLKGIALGLSMYASDYGGYLPSDIDAPLTVYLEGYCTATECAQHRQKYVYLLRGRHERLDAFTDPARQVFAYCPGPHPVDRRNWSLTHPSHAVAFLNGSVQMLTEAELLALSHRIRQTKRGADAIAP